MIDINLISQEYVKCFADKSRIYMITNYLKTYDATQRKEVPFCLFPRQKDLCHLLSTGSDVVTTKPRQAGITTTCGAFIACEIALASKESPLTILVIGNTLDLAQQMVTKIKDFLFQFPRWFWGSDYFDIDPDSPKNKVKLFKICNQKELLLENGCRVVARSSGPDASRGVGGVSYLIFDEAAFIEHGKDVYASALATVSTGGHVIMISTPNGKDQLYYDTYRQAKEGKNSFQCIELKWYQDPRYNKHLEWTKYNDKGEIEIVKEPLLDVDGNIEYNETHWEDMVKNGYKPRSPWYVRMCKGFNNNPQKIAQELDVSFLGSDSNVIEPQFIEMQERLNVREPNFDYKDPVLPETWIWKMPIEGHRYLIACLPTGEKVLTDKGLKNIEEVTLSDKLVNKEGEYVKINTIKSRQVENETMVEYKLKNMFNTIKVTWNHPIWSSLNSTIERHGKNGKRKRVFDFTFNKAIDIKAGNWIEIPNFYRKKVLTNDEILSHWAKYENIGRIDFRIENPLLNEDFWWYCGMWLAEGWIEKTSTDAINIYTAHNVKETEIHNKIKRIAKNIFNRKTIERKIPNRNEITLQFNGKQLGYFLNDNFGKYAKGKFIPEWVKFLPENLKLSFIKGYWEGDGCLTHNNIYIVSVSKQLLMGVQDILFSLGVISTLCLSSKEKQVYLFDRKKSSLCREKYTLNCGIFDSKVLLDKMGVINNIELVNRRIISNCYFSDDLEYIYTQVKEVKIYKYTGIVHNFDCNTHTYCGEKIAFHNCDNSRGDSDDATALEIIDLDGIDDDGMPCIEQVLEYNGKVYGDVIGEVANSYGHLYNDAFIVVESIGGYGDATLLTLMRLGYPNLYYDDPTLKNYTSQNDASSLSVTKDGLPGFHSSSVRFQMLSNFANLVKTNQFKIRSKRVITELDTWIFKNGKMDHKDGCHDDTITCLAMGLFVVQFSINRKIEAKKKDAAMLQAMINVNNRIVYDPYRIPNQQNGETKKQYAMPAYKSNHYVDGRTETYKAYMWLVK